MTVRLHIDRLVVAGLGLEAGQRFALGEAVERELEARLRQGSHCWPTSSTAVRRVSAAPLRIAPGPAAALGAAIAGSVDDGIAKALAP